MSEGERRGRAIVMPEGHRDVEGQDISEGQRVAIG